MHQIWLIIENMLIYTPLLKPARLLFLRFFLPTSILNYIHNWDKVLFAHLIISEKILHDYKGTQFVFLEYQL